MEIYDTTLRDGTQSQEVNLSLFDKLEILKALDDFGVDYVELGWPGSNPKDMEAFIRASEIKLKHAKISAFCCTKRKGVKASEDSNLKAVIDSKASVTSIFGKTWKVHVEKQLKMSLKENLESIYDSVLFLKSHKLKVFFDAEHFFDGYKDDKKYALDCLVSAVDSGCDGLVLCDTNGGCLPDEVSLIVSEVNAFFEGKVLLGVHAHNDSGCGVANTLAAVDSGCEHVQGTINGFGERVGNADLCQVLPNLVLKKKVEVGVDLSKLKMLSNFVYTLANLKLDTLQPYVGGNAFSHKGGVHVDAVVKGASYEHIDPSLVGNKRNIVLSDLSGKANIVEMLKEFNLKVDKNDLRVKELLKEVEVMEKKGYGINALKAEKFLLKERYFGENKEKFKVAFWKLMTETRRGEYSECVLVGEVLGKKREVVAPVHGGPVDAMYKALQKMLATKFKDIEKVKLINYKVMIAEDKGAESTVRVYIKFKSNGLEFGTVGVSENILEASMEAIEKGFRYYLLKK